MPTVRQIKERQDKDAISRVADDWLVMLTDPKDGKAYVLTIDELRRKLAR